MRRYRLDKLSLEKKASGHLSLRLSESVAWEDFPLFADELLPLMFGTVVSETDGVEMRIWELKLPRCSLDLVYEDYPAQVSLESSSDEGDDVLRELLDTLKESK
jgi:Protein of unknown function (DUF3630)